eukprot:TRINITY_DN4877_c0_g2_i1.p1 TRINITY_DN4877_c0_g2~~TRINITY_DN4877_c0_g2_i1.p1  ORF type:complete len:109 (+),score=5.74 TRINITY_DN4877_c0_g2_i1:404-730(+)
MSEFRAPSGHKFCPTVQAGLSATSSLPRGLMPFAFPSYTSSISDVLYSNPSHQVSSPTHLRLSGQWRLLLPVVGKAVVGRKHQIINREYSIKCSHVQYHAPRQSQSDA